ncbi:MAG TPA: metal ABC transporter substrate-binding protein [Candidatus Cloacimonas sp.]|jgi:zinc transport system substrate-binding protein|nr:metal ABC transporter substrate-binding protein [Candidatus Cloacimonas sp.]MDD2250782.1 metal ABC transporter substrate-binding protein [Candidatus Cloacimonadota bacterium]MCK9165268.1 metal ABC transporter substrate-binding protein [Candidatus Cloacimonas sp.]MDD3734614.1 metal ABC transporter substrate-binding protein [Candidatus Cloacimonadota bacterium]MDD3869432.1 metal ABC transporter substrate-binding protein [Candidatus Cloacimonadota bacterium]
MKYIRWILLVALLFTLSCKKQEVSQKKPLLLATIHPYELILQQLAGDEFEVSCIIPVNASPHTWSPNPADLKNINLAALILANGLGLEGNLEKNLAERKDVYLEAAVLLKDIIPLSNKELTPEENPPLEENEHHHQHSQDPHLWTSPAMMIRLVGFLEKELSVRFPNSSFVFKRNARQMQEELEKVKDKIAHEREQYSNPVIVTYHNAFHYFLQEFGIEELGFVQESPGKEPTPKELSLLGNIIKEHQVKAIFLEPQMDRKAGETLAQEFNLKLLMLDPLGSDGKAKTIAQLIDYNWQSMKGGF